MCVCVCVCVCVFQEDSWILKAVNAVDDCLEAFMGIRDTELCESDFLTGELLFCDQIFQNFYQTFLGFFF